MEKQLLDSNQRFERKYVSEINKSWMFKQKLIEKKFIKHFEKRRVVSLYFDTIDYKFFRDNIEGVGNRLKARLRWYENLNYNNKKIQTTLELKKKRGFVGTKTQLNFDSFENQNELLKLCKGFNFQNKISNIIKYQIFPVLITSYDREYYINLNKKFRSTIDTNLKVIPINNLSIKVPINKEILELKYNTTYDENFRAKITNLNFKFRFQKFSKYVVGLLNLKKNGLI